MEPEKYYTIHSGWLRASVLGANDGILSTASLVIGVAAASNTRSPIILAALAGLVAGVPSPRDQQANMFQLVRSLISKLPT